MTALEPGHSFDLEEFAKNLARMIEQGGKALAAYLKPREQGRMEGERAEIVDIVKTLGQVGQYWLQDPRRSVELQLALSKSYLDLWATELGIVELLEIARARAI